MAKITFNQSDKRRAERVERLQFIAGALFAALVCAGTVWPVLDIEQKTMQTEGK